MSTITTLPRTPLRYSVVQYKSRLTKRKGKEVGCGVKTEAASSKHLKTIFRTVFVIILVLSIGWALSPDSTDAIPGTSLPVIGQAERASNFQFWPGWQG